MKDEKGTEEENQGTRGGGERVVSHRGTCLCQWER